MKNLAALIMLCSLLSAEENRNAKSIHQLESETHGFRTSGFSSSDFAYPSPLNREHRILGKKVFGYHPYWASSSAYTLYDYSALSTIGYFSFDVDTATGSYTTLNGWTSTPIISYAHQRGVKVVLVVTNFGTSKNNTILRDTVKQNNLINNILSALISRNGDGVNIDFEQVSSSQRTNLVSFMQRLANRVHESIPNSEVSMATPAVDWSNAWDFSALGQICDYLVLMGYDYYYSGSATAGPVAPLEGESYNVTRSVTTYLSAGVLPEKLFLGVPWFGFDWPVRGSARKDTATAAAKSGTYKDLEPKALLNNKLFDSATKVPWFNYQSGTQWHQVWYDDSLSLAMKNQFINTKSLGGLGIWALSYEGGRQELWNAMKQQFLLNTIHRASPPIANSLHQNFPNPFNPATHFRFSIAKAQSVTLRIFDLLGREITVVVNEYLEPGDYERRWNASGTPSGVYIYRLQAGTFTETNKLILLK
jgi:spore germination protein YaaH